MDGGWFGLLAPGWLLWLAATALGHHLLPARWQIAWSAASCAAFLFEVDPLSLACLVALTAGTLLATAPGRRTGATVAGLVLTCLGFLAFFKLLVGSVDVPGAVAIGMPLGLSYYAFRCIHYAIERYRGRLPLHGLRESVGYLFFLPTLMAGPIHRFDAYHRDLAPRAAAVATGDLAAGLERLAYGYFKIVVLANFLIGARLVPFVAQLPAPDGFAATYLAMIAGAANGYLQFAGYSDVAIGFARLLGFTVIENFDRPFLARNLVEFWQRWHISLTSWCRDYVFNTVTTLTRRPYLAALLTMLAIGLWHELSPRYLLWGLWHGAGLVACYRWAAWRERLPALAVPALRPALDLLAILVTVHFVMLSFVLVQRPDLDAAATAYRVLLVDWWWQ